MPPPRRPMPPPRPAARAMAPGGGGGIGRRGDEDPEEAMLRAAIELSRQEAGLGTEASEAEGGATGSSGAAGPGAGSAGSGASVALDAARRSYAMQAAMGLGGGGGGGGSPFGFGVDGGGEMDEMEYDELGNPFLGAAVPFAGMWHEMLAVVSSEVMDTAGLSEGDRILLPPSVLHILMSSLPTSAMPKPMLFSLTIAGSNAPPRYAGVYAHSRAQNEGTTPSEMPRYGGGAGMPRCWLACPARPLALTRAHHAREPRCTRCACGQARVLGAGGLCGGAALDHAYDGGHGRRCADRRDSGAPEGHFCQAAGVCALRAAGGGWYGEDTTKSAEPRGAWDALGLPPH